MEVVHPHFLNVQLFHHVLLLHQKDALMALVLLLLQIVLVILLVQDLHALMELVYYHKANVLLIIDVLLEHYNVMMEVVKTLNHNVYVQMDIQDALMEHVQVLPLHVFRLQHFKSLFHFNNKFILLIQLKLLCLVLEEEILQHLQFPLEHCQEDQVDQ